MPDYGGFVKRCALFSLLCLVMACGRPGDDQSGLDRVAAPAFPKSPNHEMTPGAFCDHPSTYRYSEQIAYCQRNVEPAKKQTIIHDYDERLGYRIATMDRRSFKIDHLIPLCMGGGNQTENLWPQHRTLYEVTDPLEEGLCRLMARGVLKQIDAVAMIRSAKLVLSRAEDVRRRVETPY